MDREEIKDIVSQSLEKAPTASRHDLQWGRRLFHFSTGFFIATVYGLFLDHHQIVYLLGGITAILYVTEQVRIAYPELSERLGWLNHFFLRAEEQLQESAAVPYAVALLLTILSFPKTIALIAIYTLAIGDPLSALIGIRFGKHKLRNMKKKSLEGSLAFFAATLATTIYVLSSYTPAATGTIIIIAIMIASFCTLFELLPIRVDDNLTIPLFTAIISWLLCTIAGLPI